MKDSYNVIGLMSGTSLDGLDICYVSFEHTDGAWKFKLHEYQTVSYSTELKDEINNAFEGSALSISLLDKKIGKLYGASINEFVNQKGIKKNNVDFIASHGQTIFHQPEKGLTTQIGCGAAISKVTGLMVINDFRTKDVLHGGQGAPLVPKGDLELFSSQADAFLNIGGFANISFVSNDKIRAFDIAPANIILNPIANQLGFDYDDDGKLARKGKFNKELFDQLNSFAEYQASVPISLGVEWIKKNFTPILKDYSLNEYDQLRTLTNHIAHQIARRINQTDIEKVFITGGGAFNSYLIELIQSETPKELIIPSKEIIEYKEAIIFAFLGLLRKLEVPNCLKDVTGADIDVCGGVIHIP